MVVKFLMPFINGVFFVNFSQHPILVKNFLPESYGVFVLVNLFYIPCFPTQTAFYFKPICPAT